MLWDSISPPTVHASWTWSKWSCCTVVATAAPLTMPPIAATQTNTMYNAEALQPPACYQCYIQLHVTPNCNIATLHEVLRHSIGAILLYIMHSSPSTCWMVAQLPMVMHPASTAALQRLGCVNACAIESLVSCRGTKCWSTLQCDNFLYYKHFL